MHAGRFAAARSRTRGEKGNGETPASLGYYGVISVETLMLPLELTTMICGPPPPIVSDSECGCAAVMFAIAGSTLLVTVPSELNASMLAPTPGRTKIRTEPEPVLIRYGPPPTPLTVQSTSPF